MPFELGQPSANPQGRGAEPKRFKQMLIAALDEADGDVKKIRRVVDSLIAEAVAGSVPAAKEIMDRVDGKVSDKVDLTLGATDPLAALIERIALNGKRIHDPA